MLNRKCIYFFLSASFLALNGTGHLSIKSAMAKEFSSEAVFLKKNRASSITGQCIQTVQKKDYIDELNVSFDPVSYSAIKINYSFPIGNKIKVNCYFDLRPKPYLKNPCLQGVGVQPMATGRTWATREC